MKLLLLLCVTLSFDCPTLVPADQWPEEVSTCPVTPQDWRERAEFKTCPTSESYHCIRANDNKFYEVCLANDNVKATEEGGCVQIKFVGKQFDLYSIQYECNLTIGACPKKGTFYSTDVLYKYPGCLPPVITATTSSTTEASTTQSSGPEKTSDGVGKTAGITLGVILPAALIVVITITCLCRKGIIKFGLRKKVSINTSNGKTTNGHTPDRGSYSSVPQHPSSGLDSRNLETDIPTQDEEEQGTSPENLSSSQKKDNGHLSSSGGPNVTYNIHAHTVQIGDGNSVNQS